MVQEEALYAALNHHRIAGAAIDVWYQYPQDGHGRPSTLHFEALDNIVMTPRSSAVTAETFRGRSQEIIENISRLAAGRPVLDVVMRGRTVKPTIDPVKREFFRKSGGSASVSEQSPSRLI